MPFSLIAFILENSKTSHIQFCIACQIQLRAPYASAQRLQKKKERKKTFQAKSTHNHDDIINYALGTNSALLIRKKISLMCVSIPYICSIR